MILIFGWLRRRRRARVRARPFPAAWREVLRRNVHLYPRLSPEDRAELEGHVLVFLEEKEFEGCGGFEVTDEVRVTIAAQACVLLLRRETDVFPDVSSVLVYPTAYVGEQTRTLPDGTVVEGPVARLGESWTRGSVVLSWDDVRHGAACVRDGENVVLHEFAHQLDTEDGAADGAPPLPERSMYVAWARVLGAEFQRLTKATERGRRTFLDAYGATNPAEFFAVITEFFFERPRALQKRHPELYEQLRAYYRQDPARLPPRARD